MRMFAFEPGAVFGPIHDHKDRPGVVYILQGTITDHRDGVATDYGPGVGWPEERNTTHWLENRGTVPAVEILGSNIILGLPESSAVTEGLGRDPAPYRRDRGTVRHNETVLESPPRIYDPPLPMLRSRPRCSSLCDR